MRLTLIRKTARSVETNCPALYRTDQGSYVLVGVRVVDPDTLAQLAAGVGAGEIAIEVPADVLDGPGRRR